MADSPSQQHAKRQRVDKSGRFRALQKLKELKGQKNKYIVGDEVDNVYDVVDEKEFAKRSREKYGLDWIEDDGTGYVEDGRDVFEDNEYSSSEEATKVDKKNGKKRLRGNDKQRSGKNLKLSAFSNAVSTERKEAPIEIDNDNILADILSDLGTDKNTQSGTSALIATARQAHIKPKTNEHQTAVVKEHMQSFTEEIDEHKGGKKNYELIDRVLKLPNKDYKNAEKTPMTEKATVTASFSEELDFVTKLPEVLKAAELKFIQNKGTHSEEYTDMELSISNDPVDFQIEEHVKQSEVEKADIVQAVKSVNSEHLLDNWENICTGINFDDEITVGRIDESNLSEDCLTMWYWDAWEDPSKWPGEVFLFGKVGNLRESKSVCLKVENVDRCLYLLPREYILDPKTKLPVVDPKTNEKQKVLLKDMYDEFNNVISNSLGVTTFRSRRVTKNFAFHVPGVDVPQSCEYLEVRYEGKFPTPNVKQFHRSIAHIFGTTTTALETFLLECKIKGPCWLNIKNIINTTSLSWCKLDALCPNINLISVEEDHKHSPPPVVVLAINVRTTLNLKTMKNEIVMISCLVHNRFCVDKPAPNPPFNRHFCGFTGPDKHVWPHDLTQKLSQYKSTNTTKVESERALLNWFLDTYQNIDPDVIVTHDASDCQLDVLCARILFLNISSWSRLGRLKLSYMSKNYMVSFTGRLICDVKQSAEELIKSKSYDLGTLCTDVLKLKESERMDVSEDDLSSMYTTADGITKLITLTMQDCSYILRLMCELNVIPLAIQITNICGNLMSRTMRGGRSERNEYLLLHAFTEKNYIVPDKKSKEVNWEQNVASIQINQTSAKRRKAAYSGGLVLDPVKGFYDKLILLMDFNSLYPSIIQEYNICFTTVGVPDNADEVAIVPDSSAEPGVLPQQIRRLVVSRREVKKLMANPDLEADLAMQYNIRQLALKLTANSMYGCLGFPQSRFYAQHLAALVTFKGREILTNTTSLVQKLNYHVIYGDTDSIMINTNSIDYDQVFKIGHNIKQSVNKIYKQIELDIDGVFKYLLLLKKKKYAAVAMTKNRCGEVVLKQEYKGLDIVRRDWSQIAVTAGKIVLDEILSDKQLDEKLENIHASLKKCQENTLEGSVPLSQLTITKQLTKSPTNYDVHVTTLPHVQVALRMNKARKKRFKKGDMVSYIICDDGSGNPPMQRAYHLDELKSVEGLKVDTMYYMAQQVHPVVSRLCEPLEGTDASRIAACLGLDPNKFKVVAQRAQRERMEEGDGVTIVKTTLEKYRQCEKFKFTCISCKTENVVASAFKRADSSYIGALQKCVNPECTVPPHHYTFSIHNELILSMRKYIQRFYDNCMSCEDPCCNNKTRIYAHVMINNRPMCLICKNGQVLRQYSERDLFTQLSYFQYIFDLSQYANKNSPLSSEVERAYNVLREAVDQILENSAYGRISLSKLFMNLTTRSGSQI